MTVNERIFELMKKQRITQSQLADALQTTQSTIANWKQRGTIPPMNYACKLAEILDTSVEYLVTGQAPEEEYYTDDERKLISVYRGTNETGKLRIVEYAREMNQLHPEQEDLEELSASKIS